MSAGRTLSEAESKALLIPYGLVVPDERVVGTAADAAAAAAELGFPVVAKLVGAAIAHKTERGLVRLGLHDASAAETAAAELLAAATPQDGDVGVLIAPMVAGTRELIAGLVRDPQFGPTVMLGLGGVLAEAIADVVFRPAPLDDVTAREMLEALATQRLLDAFRGEAPGNRASVRSRFDLTSDRLRSPWPAPASIGRPGCFAMPTGVALTIPSASGAALATSATACTSAPRRRRSRATVSSARAGSVS